jgi:hypothetical protein
MVLVQGNLEGEVRTYPHTEGATVAELRSCHDGPVAFHAEDLLGAERDAEATTLAAGVSDDDGIHSLFGLPQFGGARHGKASVQLEPPANAS